MKMIWYNYQYFIVRRKGAVRWQEPASYEMA